MRLKSLSSINAPGRISSIDVFRAFAIIPVVAYHFNRYIPYGYLGVDLFFVISGLLVGSILIRKYKQCENIHFGKFLLQRGFKIWPSYYWFLIFGTLLAILFYRNYRPDYIILANARDISRYVFFYQNYNGLPFHWPFDHVWSLCVEEHFYILLPIMFIVVAAIKKGNFGMLLFAVISVIVAGIVLKILTVSFTNSKDTYSTTHSRIDALGWGVLLGMLITYYSDRLRSWKWRHFLFFAGLLLFVINLAIYIQWDDIYFRRVVFSSITPFCFFLMLMGVYYHDFSKWKVLRFIAYYSYNWYLWHPIYALIITRYFGGGLPALAIYMVISFVTAMLFTILIEETFLNKRAAVLNWIFKKEIRAGI